MKKVPLILTALTILITCTQMAWAQIGVGVGTGKISVDEDLKPGQIYTLPSITVINTGNEKSEYIVSIAYHEKQEEIKPSQEWFTFSPNKFELEPGQVQSVKITINLPIKTQPGDYFAYIEASPSKKDSNENGATIGIAAATKLYFKIIPANLVLGIYHKAISLWKYYSPWTNRALVLIVVTTLVLLARKNLNINVQFKNKNEKTDNK